MYVIKLYTLGVHEPSGHVVMDEKIYHQILDDILSYDRTPLRTEWDWEEYTREEYEDDFEIPLPPTNSVMLSSEDGYKVDDHFTKKLKQYFDSTTPQQRKELELVFEKVNELVKPFRDWIRSSLEYYEGEGVKE